MTLIAVPSTSFGKLMLYWPVALSSYLSSMVLTIILISPLGIVPPSTPCTVTLMTSVSSTKILFTSISIHTAAFETVNLSVLLVGL